jgi:hypothetical protein
VCCCSPELTHDESIKFMLLGTDEAKNRVLFDLYGEGKVVIEDDVS